MQEIQITSTATEPCHYAVDITIPAATVDATYAKTIKQLSRTTSLPGFRVGRTPVAMLRKKYGKAIQGEVLQQLVQLGFTDGVAKSDLKPVSMPSLPEEDKLEAVEGQDFSFKLEFDVAPEFEVPAYTGLELTRTTPDVTEEMITEFIDNMRQRQATFQVVERACAEGDMLKISYSAPVEEAEEDIPETARRLVACNETWMILTEPDIFPGANAQIIGANPGDEREVKITFPEDYREEFLAGKSLTYTFTVHEIHSRELPELNDELAKTLGAEDVEDLRKQVHEYYDRQITQMQQQALEGQVYDLLDKAVTFDLPPRQVETEQMIAMRTLLRERQQQGAQQEELVEKAEELRAEAHQRAALRVKMRYIVEKIAEAEELSVSDKEIADYVESFKAQSGLTESQFEKQYDSELVAGQGRQQLLADLVLERLISQATITDKAPEPHVHDENCGHDHAPGETCDHDHDHGTAEDEKAAE